MNRLDTLSRVVCSSLVFEWTRSAQPQQNLMQAITKSEETSKPLISHRDGTFEAPANVW